MCDFIFDDGGREAAGFKGIASDCVTRAIAIATDKPYAEVYEAINELAKNERPSRGRVSPSRSSARNGCHRITYEAYLKALGWRWVPTMTIGSGCQVHLVASELPKGRIIARLSGHVCAVIDGVVHDTFNPARDGRRCVYGYFEKPHAAQPA